mgnify:CR=1 FL=1
MPASEIARAVLAAVLELVSFFAPPGDYTESTPGQWRIQERRLASSHFGYFYGFEDNDRLDLRFAWAVSVQ